MYTKKYKAPMKKIKDLNEWIEIPCPQTRRYDQEVNSPQTDSMQFKSPPGLFCRNQQIDSKIYVIKQRKKKKSNQNILKK